MSDGLRSRLRPGLTTLAALAALGAAWLLAVVPLLSGGAPPPSAAPSPSPQDRGGQPAADARALQQPEQLPVETFEVFLSRDPFRPLTPAGDGAPPPPGTPPSPGAAPTEGCVGDVEVVCNGHVVTLVDVFEDDAGRPTAIVQVNSTMFTVHEGDVFADNFRVLSIDPPCVTLIFGDDTFTLCEGERVLK